MRVKAEKLVQNYHYVYRLFQFYLQNRFQWGIDCSSDDSLFLRVYESIMIGQENCGTDEKFMQAWSVKHWQSQGNYP